MSDEAAKRHGNLVLTREKHEEIFFICKEGVRPGQVITVKVISLDKFGGIPTVRLSCNAPPEIRILRGEHIDEERPDVAPSTPKEAP